MSAKVLVTHQVIEGGLELLTRHYDVHVADGLTQAELREVIADVDALLPLLTVKVDRLTLERADRLKVIANHAVGYDNVDLEAAARRGIWVTNTPDVLTEATADLTWAAILAVVRRVVEGDSMTRAGRFEGWLPTLLLGMELGRKTLGVVGFGKIGRAVARRAVGFGMRVVFHDQGPDEGPVDLGLCSPVGADRMTAEGAPLERLLAQSDVVTLHTPLTPETHHLMDARRLALMKPTAYLVNTSRGAVVDEAALVEHLRSGRLAGAALDVYEEEPALSPGLAQLANVVLLPHIGSATRETRLAMARLAADNIHAVLQGREPITPVNRPAG